MENETKKITRTENITLEVYGQLDEEPTIDLNQIELEFFKDTRVNTENWEGIPSDYSVGCIRIPYNDIDHNDYEEPYSYVRSDVYEKVRSDLFKYVGNPSDTKQKYWWSPISNTEEK